MSKYLSSTIASVVLSLANGNMPYWACSDKLSLSFQFIYTKGALLQKWVTDVLLWAVVGFRVDLDKVILLHDALPCQCLIVLISETWKNEKRKTFRLSRLPPFPEPTPARHLRDSGTKTARFISSSRPDYRLLPVTEAERWNINGFLSKSEGGRCLCELRMQSLS